MCVCDLQPTWVRDNADGVHFTLPNECMHVLIAFLCSTCLMRTCIASQPTWVRDVADALHVMLKRPETAGKTFYLAGPETLWWVVCSIACVSVCVCVCALSATGFLLPTSTRAISVPITSAFTARAQTAAQHVS